eukprot:TRINITY_DN5540_c0_g1_i4.p1 TRINITY_DN5540_c0_g1~~TRINITY_DN5540_c0_g1_i4.p1  ORF type:complete len:368 (-),score=52.47 TRINITY_DN5540_c0_g1_i4:243-1247(-)
MEEEIPGLRLPEGFPAGKLKAIIDYYGEDRLGYAFRALSELEESLAQNPEHLRFLEDLELSNSIKKDAAEVRRLLQVIRDDSDWTLVADSDEILTLYRQEANSNMHSIKIKSTIRTSLLDVIPMFNEVDLIPNILSLLPLTACRLKQVSRFRQLVYFKAGLMWPVSDRDVALEGHGFDLLEDGMVVCQIRGVEQDTCPVPDVVIPAPPPSCTRLGMGLCGAVLYPMSPDCVELHVVFNIDPKIAYIPDYFLNWVTRKLAHFGFSLFRQQCYKIAGTEWEQRVRDNREVYGELEIRMHQYFESRANNKAAARESEDAKQDNDMAPATQPQLPDGI